MHNSVSFEGVFSKSLQYTEASSERRGATSQRNPTAVGARSSYSDQQMPKEPPTPNPKAAFLNGRQVKN